MKISMIKKIEIREGFDRYIDKKSSDGFLEWKLAEESGVADTLKKVISGRNFNGRQIRELRIGLEAGIDVSSYAYCKFSGEEMQEKRILLGGGYVKIVEIEMVKDYCDISYGDRTVEISSNLDEIIMEAMELDFYSLEENIVEDEISFSRLFLEV